jgi:hypothetical protein
MIDGTIAGDLCELDELWAGKRGKIDGNIHDKRRKIAWPE